MGILQSGDPKERMQASHVLVGGRWISKGVWLEPKSLGSGMKANMPERWQDKKNAAGNRFLARTTVSAYFPCHFLFRPWQQTRPQQVMRFA